MLAPQPCIRLGPCRTRTMKQLFASAVRLRGGGPILGSAFEVWFALLTLLFVRNIGVALRNNQDRRFVISFSATVKEKCHETEPYRQRNNHPEHHRGVTRGWHVSAVCQCPAEIDDSAGGDQ